jgi:soluble lytic murein transglycosylase-like protein
VFLIELLQANPHIQDRDRILAGDQLSIPLSDTPLDDDCGCDTDQVALPPKRTAPGPQTKGLLNGGLASDTIRAQLIKKLADPSLSRFPDSSLDPKDTRASQLDAAAHANAMSLYKRPIMAVAQSTGVDPALIAGILSRESGAGLLLDANGLGDGGHGYGLMQIDDGSYKSWLGTHDWRNPLVNIRKGVSVLLDKRAELIDLARASGVHPSVGDLLTWTVSAYNAGADGAFDGVLDHDRSDAFTTGGNYAADVLARTAYYRDHGYRI